MPKRIQDDRLNCKEWLFAEYAEKKRSTGDIAKEIGFSDAMVLKRLKEFGIKARTIKEARSIKKWAIAKKVSTREEIAQRIKESVEINDKGCWIWTKGFFSNGYPCIKIDGKSRKVNRASYEAFNGEIADGLMVCHSCDDRACVNPKHLWPGTQQDNIDDAVDKNRMANGSRCHASKLTADDVTLILKDDRTQQAIAEDYGVSSTAIGKIKRRVSWKHITI